MQMHEIGKPMQKGKAFVTGVHSIVFSVDDALLSEYTPWLSDQQDGYCN